MANSGSVKRNAEAHRFELDTGGDGVAFISYAEQGDKALDLMHTEVPQSMQGKGVGLDLVKGTLDLAKAEGYRVVPSCAFVAKFIERNPEYGDLTTQ
jgi:predicted GNAT family acetyltransferase